MRKELDIFSEKLANLIRKERKNRGLSQEDLADAAGLSRRAIGQIEANQRNPTMRTIKRITNALGISLVEFVKRLESK